MANYEFEALVGFSTLFDVEADSVQEATEKAYAYVNYHTKVIHEDAFYPWDAVEVTLINSDAEDW